MWRIDIEVKGGDIGATGAVVQKEQHVVRSNRRFPAIANYDVVTALLNAGKSLGLTQALFNVKIHSWTT